MTSEVVVPGAAISCLAGEQNKDKKKKEQNKSKKKEGKEQKKRGKKCSERREGVSARLFCIVVFNVLYPKWALIAPKKKKKNAAREGAMSAHSGTIQYNNENNDNNKKGR